MEVFAKPAVGAIIEKEINGALHVLIQERCKEEHAEDNGLIEVPAGKIREYENIFDSLRREVWEETGLKLTEIQGEEETVVTNCNGYKVYSSQNLSGTYSIMLQTFICKATGELLENSDESINLRWISLEELKTIMEENEGAFYPMHINALKKYLKEKLN